MLKCLFVNRITRKILVVIVSKLEGGVWRTKTVRKWYRNFKQIDAGYGSYGWTEDFFNGPATIGNYCSFGPGLKRFEKNHIINGVTTHPCWFNPVIGWVGKDPREATRLHIGHDVWIGANVILLPGCRNIGNGAIIAAGAVVNHDVPAYSIEGGVVSKHIKWRFEKEVQIMLEESEWWNLSEDVLKNYADYFSDPPLFCQKIKEYRKNHGF